MVARSFLKEHAPRPVKSMVREIRQAIAPPLIDDTVLCDYRVEADPSEVPRLTLVFQYLKKGADWGGTATGIDLFCRLAHAIREIQPIDLRFIVTDANSETDPAIIVKWAAKAGIAVRPDQIELVKGRQDTVRVRRKETFFSIIWWNTINFAKVRAAQAQLFGGMPKPIIYLMQDYDPAFFGFSSAHMLARDAFCTPEPFWAIVNSSSLARYLDLMGHLPKRHFVFEPVILDALRPFLGEVATSERHKRVLVYGRPTVERNCFSALIRGLRRWSRDYPEFRDWEVVSVGAAQRSIDLGDGRKLSSIGKLPLEDYAAMLLGSSVGVSLMASPHPSYPPLEMAHFGVRTVTNSYLCKDLADYHPNLISISSISEEALSAAIAEACRRSASAPDTSVNQTYVRSDLYPFLGELAAGLSAAFERE
ncbi:MAG: hypothetical protein V2J14_11900 [Erythrobacter sp.]|jgi:hypothetical protein|nr:hypothetical protein [Erythrobacter sp.]